jgi:hypothetical protein
MTVDRLTSQAIHHTYHCLIGCGIGEIMGMVVASLLGWDKYARIALAIILAFVFGYGLTYRGIRMHTKTAMEAVKMTAATDTVSIASMEIIDSTMELIIPNALMVTIDSARFWWGLVISLGIAFVVTVPVNRFMIARSPHAHHNH